MSIISKLAKRHEEEIAEWFGGRKTKSSGNQAHDPADGRHSRYERLIAFVWDCKCAMVGTKSISITRDMLAKIEAQSHGERPMIPIRFYDTERGAVGHDWVAIKVDDMIELLEKAEGDR